VFLCISSYSKTLRRRIIYALFSHPIIDPNGAPFLYLIGDFSPQTSNLPTAGKNPAGTCGKSSSKNNILYIADFVYAFPLLDCCYADNHCPNISEDTLKRLSKERELWRAELLFFRHMDQCAVSYVHGWLGFICRAWLLNCISYRLYVELEMKVKTTHPEYINSVWNRKKDFYV